MARRVISCLLVWWWVLLQVSHAANTELRTDTIIHLYLDVQSTSEIQSFWNVTLQTTPPTSPTTPITLIQTSAMDEVDEEVEYTVIWKDESGVEEGWDTVTQTQYLIQELDQCTTYTVSVEEDGGASSSPGLKTTMLTAVSSLQVSTGRVSWKWPSNYTGDGRVRYTVSFPDSDELNDLTTSNLHLEVSGMSSEERVCVRARVEGKCESTVECHKNGDEQNLGLIIGLSVGLPLVLLLAGLISYLAYTKHKKEKNNNNTTSRSANRTSITMDPVTTSSSITMDPVTTSSVSIEKQLRRQFKSEFENYNRSASHSSYTTNMASRHRSKNRYHDILPYDQTLVKVNRVDYINASYILGRKFIATQDPFPDQEEDFWQLLWDANVRVVVRLSADSSAQAVARIINDGGDNTWVVGHDELKVTMTAKVNNGVFCRRTHRVVKDLDERTLEHFHLTSWEEKAPPNTDHILQLVVAAMGAQRELGRNSPILVYCGAGVGRTGTFIAVWNMIEERKPQTTPDSVAATVRQLRQSRMLMVQAEDQYVCIYNCLVEYSKNPNQWNQASLYEMAS